MVAKHGIDTPASAPIASAAVTSGNRTASPPQAINNQMLISAIDNARLELHKELGGELRAEIKGGVRGEIKVVEAKLSGEITELRGDIAKLSDEFKKVWIRLSPML